MFAIENDLMTTFPSVMMCGLDLPRVDVIVITRPYSNISSIIQAGGRGGRMQRDNTRRRVVVYLLYNATDIRSNSKNITEQVRNIYRDPTCVKKLLFDHYASKNETFECGHWCCDRHYH